MIFKNKYTPYIIGREKKFSCGYLCSHVPSTLSWTPRPRRLDVPWARKTLCPPKIFNNVYILSLGYGCGVTAILAHEAVATIKAHPYKFRLVCKWSPLVHECERGLSYGYPCIRPKPHPINGDRLRNGHHKGWPLHAIRHNELNAIVKLKNHARISLKKKIYFAHRK